MMKLENKLTSLPKSETEKSNYVDLVRIVVNFVNPREGIGADAMRKRMRILESCDKASEELVELEDEDAKLLKSLVKSHVWPMMHKDLVDFTDAIENLK